MMIQKKSYYLPTIIIITLFLLIYLIGTKVPEETIRNIVKNAGPYGVIILILFFWLSNVVAPLSGSPFLYAGFYLYGQQVVIYAFIAAFIASITNFLIAKKWGRPLVERFTGSDGLAKIDNFTKDYGLQTLFIFRLFLKEFHDVISYAFGLSDLKFLPYIVVSTLGMVPATVIWYFISLKINNAVTFTVVSWLIAYASLMIFILLKLLIRKKKKVE